MAQPSGYHGNADIHGGFVVGLQGYPMSSGIPIDGNVLTWNGTNNIWEPAAIPKPVPSMTLPAYTIATLPICSSAMGSLAYVTDGEAAPSYRERVSGVSLGSAIQLVFCDGTQWSYH